MRIKRQKYPTINLSLRVAAISFLGLALTGACLAQPAEPDGTMDRVQQLQAQQHWVEALRVLRTQSRQNPTDMTAQNGLLEMFWWTNNAYEGQLLLSQLQASQPYSLNHLLWETQFTVGPIVGQGDVEQEAQRLPYLRNLLEQSQDTPGADLTTRLYLEGMIHKLSAEPAEAEELFLRSLYANPNFLPALQALTDSYIESHQPSLAADQLAHALDLAPQNADNFYLAGRIFMEKGDPAKAFDNLQKSRAMDPMERPKRLYWVAEAERQMGKLDDAARDYRIVLSYWPNRADLWERYGRSLEGQGQQNHAQAIRAYQRAYALEPGILAPMIADAERQFWTKSLEQVLPLYQRILEIAPDQDYWLLLMSDIHYYRWQAGEPPMVDEMDTLERQIRQANRYPSPPMRLAELQLGAIRLNGWTPTLLQTLQRVNREASSPIPQALGQLPLQRVVRAKTLNDALPLPENLNFELQRWALHHFWPLPPAWITKATELNPYWLNWQGQDRLKVESLLMQARNQVFNDQSAVAEETLKKAIPFYPLHPEIYYLMAQARLKQQDPIGAEAQLQTALLLGFNTDDTKTFERFKKQLLQAKKRLQARQKRTS